METKSITIAFIVVASIFSGKIYAQNNFKTTHSTIGNSVTNIEWLDLKTTDETNLILLNWNLFSPSEVDHFTVECSRDEATSFEVIATLTPEECSIENSDSSFKYQYNKEETKGNIYFKVCAYFKDTHMVESYFVYVNTTIPVNNLEIKGIKKSAGKLSVVFTSPAAELINLNIVDQSGNLLQRKEIEAVEGENNYVFDIHENNLKLYIITLNNNQKACFKKYMLASLD